MPASAVAISAPPPDLITLLHNDPIEPITNPHALRGMGVTVVGIPAPAAWRCAAGVALFGPRAFGFDIEWSPAIEPPAEAATAG